MTSGAVGLGIVLIAKAHAEIDILDRRRAASPAISWNRRSTLGNARCSLSMRGISQWVVKAEETESVTVSVPPAPLLDLDQAALDAAEAVGDAAVQQLAFLGQHRAPGGAVEQPDAEMTPRSRPSMRLTAGWVTFSSAAAAREAAVARGGLEDEQRIAGRQHPAQLRHNFRL